MTERYNVQASTILGANYELTSIECSDYNPDIDDSITVTITVTDVYGDAVSGESVLVTASDGNFTQLNGSNITNASSVTGTTNSSGQFTLTYACSEWGLITFTANNTSTQVRVSGWKQVAEETVSGVTYTCKVNGEGIGKVHVSCSNVSFGTGNTHEKTNWIPDPYKPIGYSNALFQRSVSNNIIVYLWGSNTTIGITNTYSSSQTQSLDITIIYSYIA